MTLLSYLYSFLRGWITNIDTLLLLLLLTGMTLIGIGEEDCGKGLVLAASGGLVFFAIVPVGVWILQSLENRFPKIHDVLTDAKGLILLGGSFDQDVTLARQDTAYNLNAGRFIQFIELAKKYPHLPCVCTGTPLETEIAQKEFKALGIDYSSFLFEAKSMHTIDNAEKTAKLIKPQPDEKWVLVTSAYHMPRAVGLFRKVGFHVIPYPVDYRTPEKCSLLFFLGLRANLNAWYLGVGEWIGMIANYAAGKSDGIVPTIK
jgi:uncharacterized SAM-binding protein YcdF (DUF218 family)